MALMSARPLQRNRCRRLVQLQWLRLRQRSTALLRESDAESDAAESSAADGRMLA